MNRQHDTTRRWSQAPSPWTTLHHDRYFLPCRIPRHHSALYSFLQPYDTIFVSGKHQCSVKGTNIVTAIHATMTKNPPTARLIYLLWSIQWEWQMADVASFSWWRLPEQCLIKSISGTFFSFYFMDWAVSFLTCYTTIFYLLTCRTSHETITPPLLRDAQIVIIVLLLVLISWIAAIGVKGTPGLLLCPRIE